MLFKTNLSLVQTGVNPRPHIYLLVFITFQAIQRKRGLAATITSVARVTARRRGRPPILVLGP